jgi:NADPH2 dehydrogenase
MIPHMPGIWAEEQISAWKTIVDEVHRRGCYIFCHIVGTGRTGDPEEMEKYGLDVIGPSAIPAPGYAGNPREVTEDEIHGLIADFATAARNAVEKVGFDGVEIHACNGYLLDQFTQDVSNQRNDAWGGSIEKRARFATEVARAVTEAVGQRVPVGIRLSPWGEYAGMRMFDPVPGFTYLISELKKLKLAYLHLIEPRVSGDIDIKTVDSNLGFLEAWGTEKPVLVAGGFSPDDAKCAIKERYRHWNVAVSFGRLFISNPDLVFRVKNGIAPAKYDRATFYEGGEKGYIDYPFSSEFLESKCRLT